MILVIGAGPAGLAAAWRAAEAGHDVTVVERAPGVGGMAGSFEVAGLRVDHGSHRLHPSTPPPILDALRGLLGDDLQLRPRNGRIRLHDRWVAFPLRTGDLVRRAPRGFAARAAVDAVTGPLRRPAGDSFADVVRAGLGPTVLDAFYAPYARKLWGTDASELAGEMARRRVSAASPWDVARRLVPGRRGPTARSFLYPRRGFGAIAEALADAAVDAGATLRLDTQVSAMTCSNGSGSHDSAAWTVTLDDRTTVDADHVWSTAPLPALARRVEPEPPAEVVAAADGLRHRAMVLLYLVVDRRRWTSFDAHYFPGREIVASRLSEPRNYRDNPDDPDDVTVLCAEIPCWQADDVWAASPHDLAARLVDELARLGLPPIEPVGVEVRRLPRVYPVYREGFAEDLAAVERWAGSLPGLVTFGRQGLFTPDNTHHALAMGWAAAEALHPDGSFHEPTWLAARDGFRSFVVED